MGKENADRSTVKTYLVHWYRHKRYANVAWGVHGPFKTTGIMQETIDRRQHNGIVETGYSTVFYGPQTWYKGKNKDVGETED